MTLSNAYATLAAFKADMGDPGSTHDARCERALNAASRQIDAHCGRRFWLPDAVTVRTFTSDGSTVLDVDDIATTTGLIVRTDGDLSSTFETTLTINTDFVVEPVNAADNDPVRPYTSLRIMTGTSSAYWPRSAYGTATVQVTAKFGWPAIPADIEAACIFQARQLFKAGDATFGAFSLGDSGISMRVHKMDQVAEGLLEPYRRVEC